MSDSRRTGRTRDDARNLYEDRITIANATLTTEVNFATLNQNATRADANYRYAVDVATADGVWSIGSQGAEANRQRDLAGAAAQRTCDDATAQAATYANRITKTRKNETAKEEEGESPFDRSANSRLPFVLSLFRVFVIS